jgi:hypothetical protein
MKYTSVCAIVKDENIYLEEWVSYNLKLGFEYIIIYDNNSLIPVRETLYEYIKLGVLEVIDWPHEDGQQLMAYNDCIKYLKSKSFWIAFVDVDEFITLKRHKSINDFLPDYHQYAGVCLNWLVYNANGFLEKQDGLVVDTFTESISKDDPINMHIKVILQPRKVTSMINAHWATCKDGFIQVNEHREPITQGFSKFTNDIAFIRHYYTRSYEEWVEKLERGCVATATTNKPEHLFWLYNPNLRIYKNKFQKEKLKRVSRYLTINDRSLHIRPKPTFSLTRFQKTTISKHLDLIASILNDKCTGPKPKKDSISKGNTGIAIFLFNYYRFTNNKQIEKLAIELLPSDFDSMALDYSLDTGFSGIGWIMEYLSQNQYLEIDTNTEFRYLDRLISNQITESTDIPLSQGLISYGLYFLARMSSFSYSANYTANVDNGRKNLATIINEINNLPPKDLCRNPIERNTIDITNERLRMISFVLKMHELDIDRDKCLQIIDQQTDLLLSTIESENITNDKNKDSKLKYEDLFKALVLIRAWKILKKDKAYAQALVILSLSSQISDSNTKLDHLIGCIQIYARIYQILGVPSIKTRIEFYINRAIYLITEGSYGPELGLKNGLAGIGLALIDSITGEKSVWEELFL